MADFKIKSAVGTGNKTLLQSQDQTGSNYAIQVGDAGATTLTNATLTNATMSAGSIGSAVTGTLGSGLAFPAGHVVQTKISSRTSLITFASTGYGSAGIPVTITPAYSNSKMLIQIYGKTVMNNTSGNTGHDHIVTRTAGATESNASTTVFGGSWMNYLNGQDYSADYYPPMCALFVDSGFPNEQITYSMFGRKYSGGAGSPSWGFADYNGPTGIGYWGCMIVQEIKQ